MVNADRIRRQLADFALEPLFIEELGWDRYPGELGIAADGRLFTLRGLAEKRGMVAFLCTADDGLPLYPLRRKIEQQAARTIHEHLIIYTDGAQDTQVWQWVRRELGKPTACRELHFRRGQSGEALIQRLAALAFSLDEEAGLTILNVAQRARAAFDVERVTKRFYTRFKTEHDAFLGFITGLKSQADAEWYASVMLNRLMFVYFIQKKGFLEGDRDYLRNRLRRLQQQGNRDQFHSFYRQFVLRLFHEGLGQRTRTTEIDRLLGPVPYLNGGLFDVHELERANSDIQIPDASFERVFDFFDSYQWHLDDRPLRADNEINPDVLGYIFEQYINQKQMGAYYTKEDITGYITTNTLIPRFLERLGQALSFDFRQAVQLLAGDPDRYIFNDVRYGVDLQLPPEIAAGLSHVAGRESWNAPASTEHGLATETWRETIERRQRCAETRRVLAAGDVARSADLLALNLDLRQLAQDLIEGCETPALLLDIYRVLESLSVLDPTCGSGAFLFAALNVLQPLYEAALERMEAFLLDGDEGGPELKTFATVIQRVRGHPNRGFFVLKTIVVNNLYGVDMMEEAVEICKLRLFLRLVSQIDRVEHLEPLPDIDFNVRGGNTLVGFASLEELRQELTSRLDFDSRAADVEARSAEVDRAFGRFREMQLAEVVDDHVLRQVKQALREQLESLREELDAYLAAQFGVDPSNRAGYRSWQESHLPFHWFIEFHEIMAGHGFDVIIGNPPFVEYAKVRGEYTVEGFETLACGNLYAFVLERSLKLGRGEGRMGMISPLSIVCTSRMAPLRRALRNHDLHVPCFDIRPNGLFEGVTQRLCFVFTASNGGERDHTWSAGYRRWLSPERPALMAMTTYTAVDSRSHPNMPLAKFNHEIDKSIRAKLGTGSLELLTVRTGEPIYVHRIVRYFIKALDFVPVFVDAEGHPGRSDDYKPFRFKPEVTPFVVSLLNSSLFYWFWRAHADGFHCGYGDVYLFPHEHVERADARRFRTLARRLMQAMRENSAEKTISTKRGTIRYQEFYAKPVKPLFDELDVALAAHYDLTDEELDYVVNYDLKYRIGADN